MSDDKTMVLFGDVSVAGRLDVMRGPNRMEQTAIWLEAFDLWLSSRGSNNTRKTYRTAWEQFLAYISPSMPWEVSRPDVARWVEELRLQGLSEETVNLRVAALSSFYIYARDEYEVVLADGSRRPLHESNPAASKSLRTKINPYGKATYLTPEEARGLLKAIKRDTVQGLRDYALFLAYLATGRRNTEMRTMKWGAIVDQGGHVYYRWSGKGKKDQKFEMPRAVYAAIVEYLDAAGRYDGMQEHDYIFTALTAKAARLGNVPESFDPFAQPLSMREVGRLLKRYARKAGLDTKKIHVHTLRHTAAMLRKQAGDDPESISAFLAHSSLAITQIYLHSVEGKKDESWVKVEALLGL